VTVRRGVSRLDTITLAAASLVSLFTTGRPRALALLALALALVLLGIRLGVFARVFAGFPRGVLAAVAAVVVALVVLAYWNVPSSVEQLPFEAPELGHLPAATRTCLEKPEVESYLRDLHRALMRSWEQPKDLPAAQQVVIEFTLLPSGEAQNPRILASSFQALGRSALQALTRATPFEPLAPEVACLSGAPVRLSLSNPLE